MKGKRLELGIIWLKTNGGFGTIEKIGLLHYETELEYRRIWRRHIDQLRDIK